MQYIFKSYLVFTGQDRQEHSRSYEEEEQITGERNALGF